jgi:hypothetical protein
VTYVEKVISGTTAVMFSQELLAALHRARVIANERREPGAPVIIRS